jgi:hypothetical protein
MKKIIFAIAFGAAIVSTPTMAQRFGGGGRGHDQTRAEAQQRADMIFQMMDTNRDGVVTKAEAEQALAQFQASRGGDGEGRGGGRMQRMLDQAFGSAESLTLQQFEAQALARFDAEDLNHDGKITPDERQQAREQRMQTAPGTPAPAPQAQ